MPWNVRENNLIRVNFLLVTSHLGLHQRLVASYMHVYHTVKRDVGNHHLGRSTANVQRNIMEIPVNFPVPEDTLISHLISDSV